MNGYAAKAGAVVSTVTNDWTIVGTGDFDGDGKSDILWRNSNGEVAIWLMNGVAAKAGAVVSTVTNDWTIVGTGDFDGDGKSDILWRNSNGEVAIWLMNGMAAKAGAGLDSDHGLDNCRWWEWPVPFCCTCNCRDTQPSHLLLPKGSNDVAQNRDPTPDVGTNHIRFQF